MVFIRYSYTFIHPKQGFMDNNARVSNLKYMQHEGEARGLYVLVVTHECIILHTALLGVH